jgi:Uncharacterized protein conserved in bacteria (DUF2129).
MFAQRQGIIVWLYSLRYVKNLKKFGNIHYVSKRLKYVVLYCDQRECEQIMKKLQTFSFVKKVEPSYRPFLKTEFSGMKEDQEKNYEYRMGF